MRAYNCHEFVTRTNVNVLVALTSSKASCGDSSKQLHVEGCVPKHVRKIRANFRVLPCEARRKNLVCSDDFSGGLLWVDV